MPRYRKIESLRRRLDASDYPRHVILWNDCNGPYLATFEDLLPLRLDDNGWQLWCECPEPTEAQTHEARKETDAQIAALSSGARAMNGDGGTVL